MATYPFDTLAEKSLIDPNKTSHLTYPIEGEEDPLAKINAGIEQNIKNLQDRYAQPNWYKVAAGFAKPQLGGFMASLGSASEALGENVEQQKALEVPLFKMRTELAQNQAIMNRRRLINQRVADWIENPKNKGLPLPKELTDLMASDPEASGVKALAGQTKTVQEQQALAAQQNQIAIQKLSEERQMLESARASSLITPMEYQEKLRTLMKRAEALNSPSDVGANTNYTPPPVKVPLAGSGANSVFGGKPTNTPSQVLPEGLLNNIKVPTEVPDALKNLKPSPMSSVGKPVPEQKAEYNYIAQALKPSGEPDAYYKALFESRAKDAQTQEDRTNSILQSYYPANDPVIVNNYHQAIKDLNDMQKNKDEKAAFVAIHDLLRKNGALAAAAQEGLAVHFGNFNANLALPVKAYEAAKVPEQYRSTIDRILSNYSILANTHMLMDGVKSINPNLDADKNILSRYAHIGQTASSALHAANDNYIDFSMRKRIMEELPKIKNKIQNEHPDELAPTTSAYQSKQIKDIQDLYAQARKLELQKLRAGQNHSRQSSKQD
jgi:hypothetical protein